jgi:hypothetical protein
MLLNTSHHLQKVMGTEGELQGAASTRRSEEKGKDAESIDPNKILRSLVEYVFQHRDGLIRPLTYQELAMRIGRLNRHGKPHAHGIGHQLGVMGRALRALDTTWGEPVPHIESLVVNKTGKLRGLPDLGIKEFWPEYPHLSNAEKRAKTRAEYEHILVFGSRWNEVLERFGLDSVQAPVEADRPKKRRYGGNGESPAHRNLKRFVRDHPELFGAADGQWECIEEYILPSLDSIDVLFKSPTRWIAVEVKSRVSDSFPGDYERGVYQCVKYKALLSAMTNDPAYRVPINIDALLVLETRLPTALKKLSEKLGIRVNEETQVEK